MSKSQIDRLLRQGVDCQLQPFELAPERLGLEVMTSLEETWSEAEADPACLRNTHVVRLRFEFQ